MKLENLNLKWFHNTTDVFFTANNTEKKGEKHQPFYGNVGKAQEESPVKGTNPCFILFTNNYTSIALSYKYNIILILILLNKWPEKRTWAKSVRAM